MATKKKTQAAKDAEKLSSETLDFTSKFILWFSAGMVALTFIYIFAITFIEIPKENAKFADIILGFLAGTMISTVINYYFGSSHGSRKKDETLEILSALQNEVMFNVQQKFDTVKNGLEEGQTEEEITENFDGKYSQGFEYGASDNDSLEVTDEDLDSVNK